MELVKEMLRSFVAGLIVCGILILGGGGVGWCFMHFPYVLLCIIIIVVITAIGHAVIKE